MGIRVHKYLGYGLTDVQVDEGRIADARINTPAVEGIWDDYRGAKELRASIIEYNASRDPRDRASYGFLNGESTKAWQPHRSVFWDGEFGDPSTLILTPPSCRDWRRVDDQIDWVEETYFGGGESQANRVKVLPHGIYPWSGSYMDARTGERISSAVMEWVQCRSARDISGQDVPLRVLDEAAQVAGFADDAEAEQCVAPWVPADIRTVAEFCGLFTDPSVCNQLRPMVYTWWG